MGYLIGFLILMIVVSIGVFFYAARGLRREDDSAVTAVLFYYSMATLVASGVLLVGVVMYQRFS